MSMPTESQLYLSLLFHKIGNFQHQATSYVISDRERLHYLAGSDVDTS